MSECKHGVPYLAGCPFCEDENDQEVHRLHAKLGEAEARAHFADEQAALMMELKNKLQAAEDALAADDQASHIIEWKSRAEAAEAEVDDMTKAWGKACDYADEAETECDRLHAEVERLRDVVADAFHEVNELQAEVARLQSTLRRIIDMDPITCCLDNAKRVATYAFKSRGIKAPPEETK